MLQSLCPCCGGPRTPRLSKPRAKSGRASSGNVTHRQTVMLVHSCRVTRRSVKVAVTASSGRPESRGGGLTVVFPKLGKDHDRQVCVTNRKRVCNSLCTGSTGKAASDNSTVLWGRNRKTSGGGEEVSGERSGSPVPGSAGAVCKPSIPVAQK